MIKRIHGYLTTRDPATAPAAALELETEGCGVLPAVFDEREVAALRADIDEIYERLPPDDRTGGKRDAATDDHFRYEMLNRSATCQAAARPITRAPPARCPDSRQCNSRASPPAASIA